MDPAAEPCPRCGEPGPLDQATCPHCRGPLLVDLTLPAPVPELRRQYELARALTAAWGDAAPSLASLRGGLGAIHAPLARRLTRALARRLRHVLDTAGVAADETWSKPAPQRRADHRVVAALAVAGVAIAVMGLVALNAGRPITPTAASVPPPASLPAAVAEAPSPPASLTLREVADRATPSVASIRCAESRGTGFFVGPDTLVTSSRVVAEWNCGDGIEVALADGRRLAGRVQKRDKWLDLAAVGVEGAQARPLPIGDALPLAAGDKVLVIGSPRGLDFTVHQGIVSNARRPTLGIAYLQLDAHLDPGHSGGPLLDERGTVVGVLAARVQGAEGLGLALPVNYSHGKLLPYPEVDAAQRDRITAGWARRIEELAEQDRQEAARVAQGFDRWPGGLLAAWGEGTPSVTAMIGLRGSSQPPPSEVTLHVLQDGQKVCSRAYTVEQWTRPGYWEGTTLGWDTRFLQWLRQNGVTNMMMGRVNMQILDHYCSDVDWQRASELMLDGGTPGSDRLPIVTWNYGRDE